MGRSTEQRLSDAYIANLDIIGEGFPAWLNAARRGFLEGFNLTGLPQARDERYRHTDLRRLFRGEREQYFMPPKHTAGVGERLPVDGYTVDVANGFCNAYLTRLDNGVVYGSLKAAASDMEDIVAEHYNSVADNDKEASTALNSLFMQDGAFVYVPRGMKAEKPFLLTFAYRSDDPAQLCFARALIIVEEGAEADVVISHQQSGDAELLVDFVREAAVGQDARLNISEITRMSDGSALVCGNYLKQNKDSRADVMNVWLRGGSTRVNAATDLVESGCESNLYGLWFATGLERTDINVRVNHLVADCNSFQLVKGVASGEAVGAFTGLVYVAHDAQRTVALQQSRNLLMSDSARIHTEPQLEIYADDVKCSHGATVGQMDGEAIFYMRQRGISEDDARRLQMFGFVNDIISRCHLAGACDFMAGLAEERIGEV